MPGSKVLKERRSPRERGRMGTGVVTERALVPENSISATNRNVPGPSSSDLARYTSSTTGSARISRWIRSIFSLPRLRPNSSMRFAFMRYVAVRPRSPPTATEGDCPYEALSSGWS